MIRRLLSVSILFIQIAITFAVLFIIYMVFAVLDVHEADMISGIGLVVFQPILAIIYSGFTIVVCGIAGLPIRLHAGLYEWWKHKPVLPIAGGIVAVVLLLLSFNGNFTETVTVTLDDEEMMKQIPNTSMILAGWFLMAFSILHFYPSSIFRLFR